MKGHHFYPINKLSKKISLRSFVFRFHFISFVFFYLTMRLFHDNSNPIDIFRVTCPSRLNLIGISKSSVCSNLALKVLILSKWTISLLFFVAYN